MNPYVHWSACAHGIDADEVRLRHDEPHNALYVEVGQDGMSIRIQLAPAAYADPEQHADELERDRKGMRRLAAVATQAAQEIGQLAGLDGAEDQAVVAGEDQAAADTLRLERIRVVLAKFDWEHDDRQLALEAIDRIAEGGQA